MIFLPETLTIMQIIYILLAYIQTNCTAPFKRGAPKQMPQYSNCLLSQQQKSINALVCIYCTMYMDILGKSGGEEDLDISAVKGDACQWI